MSQHCPNPDRPLPRLITIVTSYFRLHSFFTAALICATAGGMAADAAVAALDPKVTTYFDQHCLKCHDAKKQKGHLRIDTLSRDFASGQDAERWFEMISRIGSGEMPPEDEPQPTAAESAHVMEWLTARIKEGEAGRMAKRAPVSHYRLSREEYANTVRDLLGVIYDPRAPGAFSGDPDWQGFERLGSELGLSASHVEKYLKAAAEIVERAFPAQKVAPSVKKHDALAIHWPNVFKRAELDAIGITPRIRTLLWPGNQLGGLEPGVGKQKAGIYRGRIKLSGLAPARGRVPHLTLFSKELDRMIFEADVLAPEKEPVVLEFETFLPESETRYGIVMDNAVPGPSNQPSAGRDGGQAVFTTLDDPKSREPWQRKQTDDEGRPLYPLLIFDGIEWEGPLEKPDDVAKRDGMLPADEDGAEVVRSKLTDFASRAWRRPATEEEVSRYTKLVAEERTAGKKLPAAFKTALTAMLASKNFFYLAEGSPDEPRSRLNDWELASRLSYFLWSSLPDEPLLAAARAGTLHQPEILQAQARRMMADPRSERFTASFPRQWLQLKKLGSFPPDAKLYPDYDPWLEKSMGQEATQFFAEVFRQDMPLREFIISDWTMVNARLALHYGLPAPAGSGFERVKLKPEDHRGGLLTQAGILSLTSDGTRHRPVHRGVWVMQSILGKSPPPPPANVPPIEPNPVTAPKATLRMKLEAHKANANCAACHARIDPLGLAFDHYDAIGRWRTVEVVTDGKGDNPPVDASGVLPDGRSFRDAVVFRQLLADQPDAFARAFVEKLAIYSLRRAMTVDDAAALQRITKTGAEGGYRLRTLIEAFVLSDLFQQR